MYRRRRHCHGKPTAFGAERDTQYALLGLNVLNPEVKKTDCVACAISLMRISRFSLTMVLVDR